MSFGERTFPYCRPAVMNDHFDRKHLGAMGEKARNSQISCEHLKCKEQGLKLEELDHFRNHVQRVHGVRFRPGNLFRRFIRFAWLPVGMGCWWSVIKGESLSLGCQEASAAFSGRGNGASSDGGLRASH
ncbi:hypothetical protein EDB81DRAFT_299419 [Dactylonectria macrodidyma]|uniref:Uncharacterized protein n=1 Tax=Dactylonectria macrodidyma TaxID=307937 RepID=A0A9P9D937_9HYPO|nr:hypothetical protein EDB81DRAFT_299419 [Dactylonectria macrodidyma]